MSPGARKAGWCSRSTPRDRSVPGNREGPPQAGDRGGVEPGSRKGHVLLNTHTWPDGSAMGNRLLEERRDPRLWLFAEADQRMYSEKRRTEQSRDLGEVAEGR